MPRSPTPPPRARVLVVEDSSVFREMQALLLRQAGFGVWSFEDPAAALREAAQQTFELALVDYELPGMNGQEFMQALRQLQANIPVIFVSGSLTLELVSELTRQGAAGIFSKPSNPKILLQKIREALERAVPAGELRAGAHLETGVTHPPFPQPEPAENQLAYEPRYFYGASAVFRRFTHRLWRVRGFRSVLLLHGEPGSPFELIARELVEISGFHAAPVMICERGEFNPKRLSEILAPALLTPEPGTLIVHGLEAFSSGEQALLVELLSVRGMFQPFARRFRLVLAATPHLAARVQAQDFDEALYYKLSSLTLAIPTLAEMRGDIAVNGVRLLERLQSTLHADTPIAFSADAVDWLESQPWPANHAQLAQTLFFAVRHATGRNIDVLALHAGAADYEAYLQSGSSATSPGLGVAAAIEASPQREARPSTSRTLPLAAPASPTVASA